MSDVAQIKARHQPYNDQGPYDGEGETTPHCRTCDRNWPCDAFVLLAEVERLKGIIGTRDRAIERREEANRVAYKVLDDTQQKLAQAEERLRWLEEGKALHVRTITWKWTEWPTQSDIHSWLAREPQAEGKEGV